jgi:hypothetical protein
MLLLNSMKVFSSVEAISEIKTKEKELKLLLELRYPKIGMRLRSLSYPNIHLSPNYFIPAFFVYLPS